MDFKPSFSKASEIHVDLYLEHTTGKFDNIILHEFMKITATLLAVGVNHGNPDSPNPPVHEFIQLHDHAYT